MKFLSAPLRRILCSLIILAFFLPAFRDTSGLGFIALAFSAVEEQSEITHADVYITILPLLFIPGTAAAILARSLLKLSTRKTYLAFPAICLAFFTVLLFTISGGRDQLSGMALLRDMHVGFYLALVASLLLPFTKQPRRKGRGGAGREEEREAASFQLQAEREVGSRDF